MFPLACGHFIDNIYVGNRVSINTGGEYRPYINSNVVIQLILYHTNYFQEMPTTRPTTIHKHSNKLRWFTKAHLF